jgi:hypothetical protein
MAQIVLSAEELISLLSANALIPDHVTDVETNGEEIRIKVRTPWPVLKSIRVGIRFVGFDSGCAILQLVTNRLIDTFDWLVDWMVEPLQVEDHGGRWEYPRLYVDVNRLIQKQLRGVEIKSMAFRDGHFHITTTHAPCPGRNGGRVEDEDAGAPHAGPD